MPLATAFGYSANTARDGSARARVAGYRVCFGPVNNNGYFDADVLTGFEATIRDGVPISVGGDAYDYLNDDIAIGSLHVVKC
jgi:hypothetical protein